MISIGIVIALLKMVVSQNNKTNSKTAKQIKYTYSLTKLDYKKKACEIPFYGHDMVVVLKSLQDLTAQRQYRPEP